eukprot:CAMPEP_0113881404 /NCGR_PEP_ID=MMETSP0780_2-20120614/8357_1 /TAXON_ID=652834 /ORGANISM="Palpitomonas bilix" /LENGTH=99 /DNA_ID=CAMNT_0000868257 /DNA_START=1053 /DNA_END=1352 /DNA_ORIENTATION=+ /assembly_acc=CAM_ASM_000599
MNSVNGSGEGSLPAFFKANLDDELMGDIACWSPSGELYAVGIARIWRRQEYKHEGWESFEGEGAIIILSKQGASLQYEQCLSLECDDVVQYDIATMRAL